MLIEDPHFRGQLEAAFAGKNGETTVGMVNILSQCRACTFADNFGNRTAQIEIQQREVPGIEFFAGAFQQFLIRADQLGGEKVFLPAAQQQRFTAAIGVCQTGGIDHLGKCVNTTAPVRGAAVGKIGEPG